MEYIAIYVTECAAKYATKCATECIAKTVTEYIVKCVTENPYRLTRLCVYTNRIVIACMYVF